MNAALAAALVFLTACGEDANGNGDTLLTGLSGFIIFVIVVWLIVRWMSRQ